MNTGLQEVSLELPGVCGCLCYAFPEMGQVTLLPLRVELYSGCSRVFLDAPAVSVSEAGGKAVLSSGIFDLLCSISWWCETCFSLS